MQATRGGAPRGPGPPTVGGRGKKSFLYIIYISADVDIFSKKIFKVN